MANERRKLLLVILIITFLAWLADWLYQHREDFRPESFFDKEDVDLPSAPAGDDESQGAVSRWREIRPIDLAPDNVKLRDDKLKGQWPESGRKNPYGEPGWPINKPGRKPANESAPEGPTE